MAINLPQGQPQPGGGTGAGVEIVGATVALIFEPILLQLRPQLTVNGAASVEQIVRLARSAVVEPPYTVTVQAGRAEWALAGNVGGMHQQDVSSSSQPRTTVVLDFGMLRTVAAVALRDTSQVTIAQVKSWTGVAFSPTAVYSGISTFGTLAVSESTPDLTVTARAIAAFSSEIRTERLQIDLLGKADDATLSDLLLVKLPDVPADLELRINGGAPVWSAPGPVTAGAGGWQDAGNGLLQQTVDLSAALTALLADPTSSPSDLVDLHLVLSARTPGALTLDLPDDPTILHLTRVAFEQETRDVVFAGEGLIEVPLPLPGWASAVARLQATVSGKPPALRVLPPLGPDAVTVTRDGVTKPLAELVLDPDHAAALALPRTFGLVSLTGVRVPLRPGDAGAEVRVQLLQNVGDEPGAAVDGGASDPVTLDPPSGAADVWTTFALPAPVDVDAAAPPFVQVVVTRGGVTWALTDSADGGQAWRGPPAGPLQELPTLGTLASLRARARVLGTASPDAPVAALQLALAGAADGSLELTPAPKGVAVELRPAGPVVPGADGARLELVARVAGTVTLANVLAVVTTG